MSSAAFDTLRFARTLREKGNFSTEQAEGLADAMVEALQADVATKSDVEAIRADVEALRADVRQTELRLKADIEATKAEILKWMFGTIGFQTIVILGTVIALARFGK